MIIKSSALKAVSIAAARNDIRYYLNGVYADNTGALVATNGHRLHVHRIDPFEGPSFILPIEAVDNILKAVGTRKPGKRSAPDIGIEIKLQIVGKDENGEPMLSYSMIAGSVSIGFVAVSGEFPEWRRVIPNGVSFEIAQFDADYIRDVKIAESYLSGVSNLAIAHNGNGGALVTTASPDFVAVVMPIRNHVDMTRANWIHGIPEQENQAA